MSSTPYARPLRLELRPSRFLTLFVSSGHVLALFAAWAAAVPDALRLVLTIAVLVSGWRQLWRAYGGRTEDPSRIIWGPDGAWSLYGDGRWQSARLVRTVYEHPFLVVLPLRTDDGRIHRIVIAPDAVDVDSYRRLRVRIRHMA